MITVEVCNEGVTSPVGRYEIRNGYSSELITQSALEQRIRRRAKEEYLVAKKSRSTGKWYFANYSNLLMSPETGLTDPEALQWLVNDYGKPSMEHKQVRYGSATVQSRAMNG